MRGVTDTETGMLPGIPGSAMCVQRFDDSLSSAIRITYRISLRSSSMWEPRHPSLKVVFNSVVSAAQAGKNPYKRKNFRHAKRGSRFLSLAVEADLEVFWSLWFMKDFENLSLQVVSSSLKGEPSYPCAILALPNVSRVWLSFRTVGCIE